MSDFKDDNGVGGRGRERQIRGMESAGVWVGVNLLFKEGSLIEK